MGVGRWFQTTLLRHPVQLPPREEAPPANVPLAVLHDWLLLAAVVCVAAAIGALVALWSAKPSLLKRQPGLVGLLASLVLGTDLSVLFLRFGPSKAHEFLDECCATLGRWAILKLGPDHLIVRDALLWTTPHSFPPVFQRSAPLRSLMPHRSCASQVVTDPEGVQDIFAGKKGAFSNKSKPVMAVDWFFKDSLLTMQADQWRHDRTFVNGAIAGHRIDLVYPAMHAKLGAIWDKIDGFEGNEFDLSKLLPSLIVDVFGEFALGVNLNTIQGHNKDFFEALTSMPAGIQAMTAEPPWTWELPTPRNLRLRRARATVDTFIRKLLDDRPARLEARTAAGSGAECLLDRLLSESSRGKMSEKRVMSNIGIFFIGSFEYISNTIFFTLEFLSGHPEVVRKLRAELAAHRRRGGRAGGAAGRSVLGRGASRVDAAGAGGSRRGTHGRRVCRPPHPRRPAARRQGDWDPSLRPSNEHGPRPVARPHGPPRLSA